MASKLQKVIVMGTSAGGLEALDRVIGDLPRDLPAAVFIVQHLAPGNSGEPLLRRLRRHTAFDVAIAKDGDPVRAARIALAPPDSHLLLKRNKVLVTKVPARTATGLPSIRCFGLPLWRTDLA
jgi:two-component system chemotaxis response regulator CheB